MWSSQPGHGLLSWHWVYPSPASRSTGMLAGEELLLSVAAPAPLALGCDCSRGGGTRC